MKPQLMFFLFIMIVSLFFMNYSRINKIIHDKDKDEISFETVESERNPTFNNITRINLSTDLEYPRLKNATVTKFQVNEKLGNEYNTNRLPTIIDSNNIHVSIINNVLNNTNKYIVDHINSITIIYGDSVDCSNENVISLMKAIGCAEEIKDYNSNEISVDIRLVDNGFWQRNSNSRERSCGSFEGTLNHEIGHVEGFMNNDTSELYADNYAKKQFSLKNKTTSGVDGENSQSAFERIESLGQDQCINSI